MFKNVGVDNVDLTTVKVVGYTGASSDKASVQFIDAVGNVAKDGSGNPKKYYWRDSNGSSGKWVKKNGRTITDVAVGEAVIAAGDALWCQKEVDGLSLQFAGEVIQTKAEVALPLANQAVGNMMAVAVDITTVTVAGYTGSTSDKVSVQFIDAAGNVDKDSSGVSKKYYWRDNGSVGKWVKKNGRTITDLAKGEVVMNPGEGIWVQNEDTATPYKLVFEAPAL